MTTRASAPRVAGRYELLDRLGSGGMAEVFLALAKGPFDAKRLVVLKRPRAAHHEYAAMFMDEARLAMRLNHPNVVQTHEVGVDEGGFFLAMEYLEGQPLHRVLQAMVSHEQHLSHAQLARVASDALAGLHYAHELRDYDGTALQIVHRDVSPHNVFVTYDGQIKVVDFGIAKATMNEVHTRTGDVKGKLAYMAPEQAIAETVDRRADLFAVGVILWEMIARRRLVTGSGSAELLDNLLTMDFPPLSCEVADVHPVLEAIVMRALQRDPADRYGTALEMREALESFVGMADRAVRASDIGGVVSGLFAGPREELALRIRAQLQSGAARPPFAPSRRGEWRTPASFALLAVAVLALAGALIFTMRASGDRTSAAAAGGSESADLVGVLVPAVTPTTAETLPLAASVTPSVSSPSATSAVVAPPHAVPPPLSPAPSARPPPLSPAPRRGGPSGTPATPKRPIDTSFPK